MRKRKSSVRITLVLIGAAGLAACGGSSDSGLRRDVYASLADCKADWDREELCQPAEGTSSGSGASSSRRSGGYYYGPTYRSGSSSTSATHGASSIASGSGTRTSRSIGTQSVARGGFGSSSSFHGSSSS